jgi:tetratricopeptide (TPR) repeat protein
MGDAASHRESPRPFFARSRRWFVIGLLLGGVGVGVYFLYPQARAVLHWRQAQQALDQNDFATAQTHLKVCLQVWPHSGETHFLMARTCRRAGDLDGAKAQLQEARRLHWDSNDLALETLLLKAQLGMIGPIEQTLRACVQERHRDERLILEAWIMGCLEINSLPEAFGLTKIWSEHFPEDWQPSYWRGRALQRAQRYDLAVEEYEKALTKNPNYPPAHRELAEVLRTIGLHEKAVPHFQTYLEKAPDDGSALLGFARCQRTLGQMDSTRATVERFLALYPDHPGGLLLRGLLELDKENPDGAADWLRRSLAKAPHDKDANQALANALRKLGRIEEAWVYEKKAQQISQDLQRVHVLFKEVPARPKEVELRYELGTLLLGLGEQDQGIRWLVGALLLDPNHEKTKKALLESLKKLDNPQLLESYRSLLEVSAGMEGRE